MYLRLFSSKKSANRVCKITHLEASQWGSDSFSSLGLSVAVVFLTWRSVKLNSACVSANSASALKPKISTDGPSLDDFVQEAVQQVFVEPKWVTVTFSTRCIFPFVLYSFFWLLLYSGVRWEQHSFVTERAFSFNLASVAEVNSTQHAVSEHGYKCAVYAPGWVVSGCLFDNDI